MVLTDDPKEVTVSRLVGLVREISGFSECRTICKKMCSNLVRRIKLLSPLFEELKDAYDELSEEAMKALDSLRFSLESAKELLKSVNEGSKLYQVLKMNQIVDNFHQMTEQIEVALNGIPYDKIDIPEEVKEQIALVHAQFRRAKERKDLPDLELIMDLDTARKEKYPDLAVLRRISDKMQIQTINDLKKESHAFHELVISSDGDPGNCFENMSSLLNKLKDCVLENPETETYDGKKGLIEHRSPVIPDDFRCPISLELMKDPVIVSTGQTYERSCIQKWLDAGHKTCPKTQQTLLHTALTPNYVLKSLITLWCESNGIELPKKQGNDRSKSVIELPLMLY